MYLVDPSALSPDLWAMMRSAMQLLQHGLLCLTALTASANVVSNGVLQGASAQYLLGLGESPHPSCMSGRSFMRRTVCRHWGHHWVAIFQLQS